ncbi:MAG: hypothetical protein ABFD10_18225 [Prolixibacteraceae bacterium]
MRNLLTVICILLMFVNCQGNDVTPSDDLTQPGDVKADLKRIACIRLNSVRSVAVKEKIVFIVGTEELAAADIADPCHPQILSRVPLEGVGCDIELKGDYAFVACRMGGIQVFDVKNPSSIRYLATYDSIEQATGIAVNGDILICCNRTVGVETIDISNPEKLKFLGKIKTPEAQGAKSRGNYAYIGEHYKKVMTILDISDPAHPKPVKSVSVPGNAWGVAIKGNYAYVAHGHGGHGVSVIDIREPENARLVTSYTIPLGNETRSPDCWEVQISGNKLFFANGYDGVYVFDISEPEKLTLLASYTDVNYAHDLALTDNLIILADYKNGCQLISAEGLAGPQYLDTGTQPEIVHAAYQPYTREGGMTKLFSKGQVHSCFLDDKYIYMACGSEGLEIADIADPRNRIATFKAAGTVYDVVVSGKIAYLSCGAKGLQAVDLTDIRSPRLITTIGAGRFLNDMWINDHRIILRTDTWATTGCIDISDEFNPQPSAKDLPVEHFMHQVSDGAFNTDYFAAANAKSLLVLKYIKSPLSLEKVTVIQEPTNGVAVKDSYIYRSSRSKSLHVYDAKDPQNPHEIFSEKLATTAAQSEKLSIDCSKLYITTNQSVMIYDLADAAKPKFIKEIAIPGIEGNFIYGRIKSHNGKLYVCTGYSCLWIIDNE